MVPVILNNLPQLNALFCTHEFCIVADYNTTALISCKFSEFITHLIASFVILCLAAEIQSWWQMRRDDSQGALWIAVHNFEYSRLVSDVLPLITSWSWRNTIRPLKCRARTTLQKNACNVNFALRSRKGNFFLNWTVQDRRSWNQIRNKKLGASSMKRPMQILAWRSYKCRASFSSVTLNK